MKLGKLQTARGIFDLVQNDLEQVEKKISAESVASVEPVTAIGRYLQSAGGKRLRPALLLLSAKLVGHGNAGPSAIQMGAVVELLAGGQRIAVSAQRRDFFDIGTPESYKSFTAFVAQTPGGHS